MPVDHFRGSRQLAGDLGQMAQYKQHRTAMANELALKYIPHVTRETYDDFMNWNEEMGGTIPRHSFESDEHFNRWQSGPLEYKEPKYEQLTIYGPKGATRRIPNVKGTEYIPPKGWSLKAPSAVSIKDKMTESKAREKKYQIAKYRNKLEATGGMDEMLFGLIAKEDPELAESMKGKALPEAMEEIDRYERWLDKYIPDNKSTTYTWKDGKLVPKYK